MSPALQADSLQPEPPGKPDHESPSLDRSCPRSLLKMELPGSTLMVSDSAAWIQGPEIGIYNKFPEILMYSPGRET